MFLYYSTLQIFVSNAGNKSQSESKSQVRNALFSIVKNNSKLALAVESIEAPRGGNALAAVTGGRIQIGVGEVDLDHLIPHPNSTGETEKRVIIKNRKIEEREQ